MSSYATRRGTWRYGAERTRRRARSDGSGAGSRPASGAEGRLDDRRRIPGVDVERAQRVEVSVGRSIAMLLDVVHDQVGRREAGGVVARRDPDLGGSQQGRRAAVPDPDVLLIAELAVMESAHLSNRLVHGEKGQLGDQRGVDVTTRELVARI